MTLTEQAELLAAIKANRDKLDACPVHRFDLGDPPYAIGMKTTCLHCGGSLSLTDINQYARGYKAAGGNPDDVVIGWSI